MKILLLSLVVVMALVQGGRICTNPKGNDGESYTEGCLKMTCKTGIWRSSLDTSLCCYNKQPYLPNTTITATEDGCAMAVIFCKQEDGVATAVLQVENTCGEHSTEEQVQELKHLLVQHMEQTDCDKDSPVSTSTTSTTTNPTHGTEGLVISGGDGPYTSVEMFIPSTKHSCTLPSLPDERISHTMSGLTICGGEDTTTSCLQLSSGVWSVSHTLQEERYGHSSWQSDKQGVILMGGYDSGMSSEVVGQGGVSFDMRYDTIHACAIPDGESVLLTGGWHTKQRVSRYNATGYVAELPGLNIGRQDHGCGAYLRQDGTKVFLVAGGVDDSSNTLSATELMLEDSDVWSITSPLPWAVRGVRGVTLGNTLYMSGGRDEDWEPSDEILAWSDESDEWEEVGKMKESRVFHAISTINVDEVVAICG